MKNKAQPLQASPYIHKGAHPFQSHTMGGFKKDSLPCKCMVAVVLVAVAGT